MRNDEIPVKQILDKIQLMRIEVTDFVGKLKNDNRGSIIEQKACIS